ncbi:MAG: hypothetical protein QXX64_03315 [Nitrososphaera sp.]
MIVAKRAITLSSTIDQSCPMADAMFMYAVMTGIMAFLVAVCFGARGARKRREPAEAAESHSTASSSSGGGTTRRIKKFKSDGTPVYE